jgi:hypothetical protein
MIWVVGEKRGLEADAAEDDTPGLYYGHGWIRCHAVSLSTPGRPAPPFLLS